ncbi:DUF2905 family protein [Pontibacillus yanchengensis]|uniref:DUF2905 family protein n=1 Tax=Pontibacillus yanchengensis TaxID=462910 RepID=A0ACC7VGY5_9BACI|nr:DUF2905 domain-containing protein [Pontibacillus yanchengensis]MYL53384.1 DUF2905 family protein [Pontibacillus yanchengensis]
MTDLPKLFIIIGVIFIIIGLIWTMFGKLPGDIAFKKGNVTFYFPIVTSIIVSIVLSLIFYIIGKIR